MIDHAALARRLAVVRDVVQGGPSHLSDTCRKVSESVGADPRWLAERVLASCKVELNLPVETRIEWVADDIDSWGEYHGKRRSTVLRLSTALLEPAHTAKIPNVVGHEARHCWAFLGVRDGLLPIKALLDDHANEQDAADYGRATAERWRHLL